MVKDAEAEASNRREATSNLQSQNQNEVLEQQQSFNFRKVLKQSGQRTYTSCLAGDRRSTLVTMQTIYPLLMSDQ